MKQANNRERLNRKSSAAKDKRNFYIYRAMLLIIVAASIMVFFWFSPSYQSWAQSRPPEVKKTEKAAKIGFDRLNGAWRRQDGGYVIAIKEIKPDGGMAAEYFNPKSINVSRAVALREGKDVKVFLELQDVNYPGSTYHLTYDPKSDQLKGTYFQAALKQMFDVVFDRLK
jgi:hypothetical protein